MTAEKQTLGAAIDEVVSALQNLDEATRLTAIRAACEHLKIAIGSAAPVEARVDTPPSVLAPVPHEGSLTATPVTDIRTFKDQKQPANANEMASVLAYFLQHLAPSTERKTEISAADIDKYFVQANFPLPKRSDQLLVNAKAAGYFDSAGRGAYKLNPVGHNLVAHTLPRATGGTGGVRKPAKKRTAKSLNRSSKTRSKRKRS